MDVTDFVIEKFVYEFFIQCAKQLKSNYFLVVWLCTSVAPRLVLVLLAVLPAIETGRQCCQ